MSDYAFNYQVIKHEVSSVSYIDYRDCLAREANMVARNGKSVWVANVDGVVRKTDAGMLCNVVSDLLGPCNVVAAGIFLCNPCDCRGWKRNVIDPKPLGDGSFILENTTRHVSVFTGRSLGAYGCLTHAIRSWSIAPCFFTETTLRAFVQGISHGITRQGS